MIFDKNEQRVSVNKRWATGEIFGLEIPADAETLISGGDDYEILCTVTDASADAFVGEACRAGVAVSAIGTVIAGNGPPKFLDEQGREIRLSRLSYSHF